MKFFRRALGMELRRSFLCAFSPAAYLATLATMLLNVCLYMRTDSQVSVAFLVEYVNVGSLGLLFFVWGVLPHGTSYCADRGSGFLRQVGVRCPVRAYAAAKCCAAFLSSALTMLLAAVSYAAVLSLFRPLDNEIILWDGGYRSWRPGHPLFYFAVAFTLLALGSGLFSVVGLWISSHIPNLYAVLAAPLLLYYAQQSIVNWLNLRNWPYLFFSSIYYHTPGFASPAVNFFYSSGYLLVLAALFAVLFIRRVERRWENG